MCCEDCEREEEECVTHVKCTECSECAECSDCAKCNDMKCVDCDAVAHRVYSDGKAYCDTCWEYYDLMSYRCFTFAAVYDISSGKRLSVGSSISHTGCAERQALWRLSSDDFEKDKGIVVCRIRKNRNDTKQSFGMSKPCKQCIIAMQLYNVTRVCYSISKHDFSWQTVAELTNEYSTKSNVIVSM